MTPLTEIIQNVSATHALKGNTVSGLVLTWLLLTWVNTIALIRKSCIHCSFLYCCESGVYLDQFYCFLDDSSFCIRINNSVGKRHCLEIFCWLTSCLPRLLSSGAGKPFYGTSVIRVCREQILASQNECWLKAVFFGIALKSSKSQHHPLFLITLCVSDHYVCS